MSRFSDKPQFQQFDAEISKDLQRLAGLPAKPPYAEWEKAQGGKFERVGVQAYFYDQQGLDIFLRQAINRGFRNAGENVYEGVAEGSLPVRITVSLRSDDDSSEIEKLARNEKIQIIYYAGHSGVGANLYKTFTRLPAENYPAKIYALESCKSLLYYSSLLTAVWPQAQIVGTAESSAGLSDRTSA